MLYGEIAAADLRLQRNIQSYAGSVSFTASGLFSINATVLPNSSQLQGSMDFINGVYAWQDTSLAASDCIDQPGWIGASGLTIAANAAAAKIIYSDFQTFLADCDFTIVAEVDFASYVGNIYVLNIDNATGVYYIQMDAWNVSDYDGSVSRSTGDFINGQTGGTHKVAYTRTNSKIVLSVDGNSISSSATSSTMPVVGHPMTNFMLGGWETGTTHTAINIRKLDVYVAQANADLPLLSRLTPTGSAIFAGTGTLAVSASTINPVQQASAAYAGVGQMTAEASFANQISASATFSGAGGMTADLSSQYSSEVTQFINRTSGLDATHVNAYEALIDGLVSDGVWSKFDALWVFATQDQTTALLNLCSSSLAMSKTLTPTFTADQGFNGNDTNYLDDGANLDTLTNYTQNSAHLMVWSLTSGGSSARAIGTAGENNDHIHPRYSDGNGYFRVNNATGVSGTVANTKGCSIASRTSSVILKGYKNGSEVATSGSSTADSRRQAHISVPNAGAASTDIIAAASIGAGLDATEQNDLYGRLYTYLQAVGISSPT